MTADPNNSRIYYPELTGDPIVDTLYSRVTWGLDNLNETITYAFPDATTDYNVTAYHAQSPFDELSTNFGQFSTAQRADAVSIFRSIESFTTASFVMGSDATANIRLANSGANGGAVKGWAYYAFPDQITAGDIWIDNYQSGYANPVVGTSHHLVLLHEIGHTLGLDHSWETTHGTKAIEAQYDSHEYTVMSYNGYSKANGDHSSWGDVGANSYAQTFMMWDIYTLQYMHGADYSTNGGNTVYHWEPTSGKTYVNGAVSINPSGNKIFATLWDGGGVDTYDLSRYNSAVEINLSPGKESKFSTTQRADLGDGVQAAGNIYNAFLFGGNTASLIENAIGGSGADILNGNQIDNVLTGNGGKDDLRGRTGNDTLIGNGGLDILFGGEGNDTLTGGIGANNNDTFLFRGPAIGNDRITDWQDGVDVIKITNTSLTTFAQVQANAVQVGSSIVISIPASTDSITIDNWSMSQLSASDFLFV